MSVERLLRIAPQHRTIVILSALLSTFAGVDLLLNRPKGSELQWLAAPFLAVGAGLFALVVRPHGIKPSTIRSSLANRLLYAVTFQGRLIPFLPFIGIALVVGDLVYNAALSASPALLTEDIILLLGAFTLISYGFVPIRFARERDFVFAFFVVLNIILVAPLLIARAYYADFDRSVDVYSWVALAPQTSAVLNLLGVSNTVNQVPGSTAPGLTFQPQHLTVAVTVVITTACSGIYSFGIFASAFVAFVATEYERSSRRVWILLALGLATAYFANVLRMVVIVLVGYYTETMTTDLQNMLIAHSYVGWIIFLGWIALFWALLLRFCAPFREPSLEVASVPRKRGVLCGVCSGVLTPALTGYRCECGKFYHARCAMTVEECPQCHRPMKPHESQPQSVTC